MKRLDLTKETPEQRAERIKYAKSMTTKVVNSKKTYKRKPKHKGGNDYE